MRQQGRAKLTYGFGAFAFATLSTAVSAEDLVVSDIDAVLCRDWLGIRSRILALEEKRFPEAHPPGPPECVDLPEGTRLRRLGEHQTYVFKNGEKFEYLLVAYAGVRYWVRSGTVETEK
jgi:hypothetical protein